MEITEDYILDPIPCTSKRFNKLDRHWIEHRSFSFNWEFDYFLN